MTHLNNPDGLQALPRIDYSIVCQALYPLVLNGVAGTALRQQLAQIAENIVATLVR
jgi:hypothetical protein